MASLRKVPKNSEPPLIYRRHHGDSQIRGEVKAQGESHGPPPCGTEVSGGTGVGPRQSGSRALHGYCSVTLGNSTPMWASASYQVGEVGPYFFQKSPHT